MRRERKEHWVEWNHKSGVEALILPIRECDPTPSKVDPGLLGFGQNRKHVGVPLSKLVYPVGNVSEALCVHDDVVEPFLKRESEVSWPKASR